MPLSLTENLGEEQYGQGEDQTNLCGDDIPEGRTVTKMAHTS